MIRVSHNGLFDVQMKILEIIDHAQVEFFILIIKVPYDIIDWGYLNTLRE